ncbi:helix-turn-helix domain-containing protein [Saccharothrix longispora]|uniref:helix-turn-helix domain-containing protein n=1 Tax=Saccharothrix longispora TaxID=33920 RepID=UPI00286C5F87|nr:helix-turn-helix transcriptional regulator [Saccharothrix longispora]
MRAARKRARVPISDLVEVLGLSVAWLSKVENGTRRTDAGNIARLLGFYRADQATVDRVMSLHADPRDWFVGCGHGPGGVDELAVLLRHEAAAREVFAYETVSVPALAQTPVYGRAVLERNPLAVLGEVEQRTEARKRRQRVLSRPSRFVFVVREMTLRNLGVDRRTASDQLRHLALLPNTGRVEVRVLPRLMAGSYLDRYSFTLMRSEHYRPVVHVDAMYHSVFLDHPDDVAAYQAAAQAVLSNTLSVEESQALILHLANGAHAVASRTG